MNFRHGQMHRGEINNFITKHTQRVPLREHPLFSNNGNMDNSFCTDIVNVECNSISRKDCVGRIPLSELPYLKEKVMNENSSLNKCNDVPPKKKKSMLRHGSDKENLVVKGNQKTSGTSFADFTKAKQKVEKRKQVSKCLGTKDPVDNFGTPIIESSTHINNETIEVNVVAPRKRIKRNITDSISDISQVLFSNDDEQPQQRHFNDTEYTEIEHSHVLGYDTTDAEFFSDDGSESGSTINENSSNECDFDEANNSTTTSDYATLGPPSEKCQFCEAYMWKEERVRHNEGMTPRLGDNPDIVARVFRLKLDQLLNDIKKGGYFGVCIGVMYVVEFQKRGLPHTFSEEVSSQHYFRRIWFSSLYA
ncbi:hypothetical protein POM88_007820 [Heracleum sosnowskyi]|uniref:Helitron helicase-like domain-containing protein n=1 Tax=Heracleum sosnowskyi TaxID=360622 RepID=A0AAD8J5A7_9APIA|nr:hypothetical protein POM88_023486 [Heracleum sosnowskyi]KAK1397957.1 hypothetical protein POM88_007820 [Heracleum sosnowskyi]